MCARDSMWLGVEWTKALGYGWLRLFVLLAVFLKTHGDEDKWTFSAFFLRFSH